VGTININDNKKCKQIAGNFDHHGDVAVQCGVHCPMKLIQGFTRSHWMLSFGKCLHRIAPAAIMVGNFSVKHKTLPKHNF
jgi:hypothetical protein